MSEVDDGWFVERGNVAEFVAYMIDTRFISSSTVAEIIEKPWKWKPEYEQFRRDADD